MSKNKNKEILDYFKKRGFLPDDDTYENLSNEIEAQMQKEKDESEDRLDELRKLYTQLRAG